MIDNQIHRNQRIDLHGILAKVFYRIPHGGKIHHSRYAGKILHQHPGRMKRYLNRLLILLLPASDIYHIFFFYRSPIQFSQQVFNQYFNGKRKSLDVGDPFFLQASDIRNLVNLAVNIYLCDKFFWIHRLIFLQYFF